MIGRIRSRKKKQAWFMAILGTVSFVFVTVVSIIFWYGFVKDCEGYLKLAGDAPSIEKADSFLGHALHYIETNNLTHGNSALMIKIPQNDVGIWYEQIKGAKDTTEALLVRLKENPMSVSQVERDNALMKIREVVLDTGKKGVSVTAPVNIDWYPHQWGMVIWWVMSIFLTIAGWIYVRITIDYL